MFRCVRANIGQNGCRALVEDAYLYDLKTGRIKTLDNIRTSAWVSWIQVITCPA